MLLYGHVCMHVCVRAPKLRLCRDYGVFLWVLHWKEALCGGRFLLHMGPAVEGQNYGLGGNRVHLLLVVREQNDGIENLSNKYDFKKDEQSNNRHEDR